MNYTVHVPAKLRESFDRLLDLVPVPFKYEKRIQQDILHSLDRHGEAYVHRRIEEARSTFAERVKRK